MEALLIICGIILAIDIFVCVLAEWITSAQLNGGLVNAWKVERYRKRLRK